MIVVDASAVLELLLQTPRGENVERRLFRDGDELHVPHLIDVEITQGLRRLVRSNDVAARRAAEALEDLAALDFHRHTHGDLIERAWALRNNITAYDAMYIALAEGMGATVVTCDGRLGSAPGHRARVEVID